jgi:hypothetical protein
LFDQCPNMNAGKQVRRSRLSRSRSWRRGGCGATVADTRSFIAPLRAGGVKGGGLETADTPRLHQAPCNTSLISSATRAPPLLPHSLNSIIDTPSGSGVIVFVS